MATDTDIDKKYFAYETFLFLYTMSYLLLWLVAINSGYFYVMNNPR